MKINYITNTIECKGMLELNTFIYMLEPRVIYQVRFNSPFGTDGGTGGKIIKDTNNHITWLKDSIEGSPDWQMWMKGDIDSSEFFYKINNGAWKDTYSKLTNGFINGKFEIFGEVFPVSENKFLHTDKQIPGYVYYGYGITRDRKLAYPRWFLTLKPLTPYYKKVYINIEYALQDFEGFDLSISGYIGQCCCEPTLRLEVKE